jgi:vancomycin resistance protein YoaR
VAKAKQRSFGWTAAAVVAGLLAVLGGAYLAIHYAAGDKLPANAVVAGVNVGGLTPPEAQAQLRGVLEPVAIEDLTIYYQDKKVVVTPDDISLEVDYQGSLKQAGGGEESWNLVENLNQLFGGEVFEAIVHYDAAGLQVKLSELADQVNREPVDATLAIVDGKPEVSDGVDGLTLDEAASAQVFDDGLLHTRMFGAVVKVTEPDVTTDEAKGISTSVATPAISAPVTVQVGDQGKLKITKEVIAATLAFEPKDGTLVPVFDSEKLNSLVAKDLDELGLQQPVNAKFTIGQKESDKPKIVPSEDGIGIDINQLAEKLVPALQSSGDREVSVDTATRPAEFSTADAEKMGVKEITGEFTTYFPGSAYRYNNIGKAAKLINGTYLAPGEEFSMNKTLGERTPEAGWMKGGGIANGKIDPNIYGGGVSQSTTTTFNAIFFAGLKDIYHKPHSLYFSRYPMGREATLDWKMVDMKFQNDSDYGVLLQAWITGKTGSQGSVTVRVWSTKVYEIKSTEPVQSNWRAPGKTVYDESKGCVAQSAMSGFDVRFNREFYKDGKLVKTEPFKWSYNSLTKVVCGKKPEK